MQLVNIQSEMTPQDVKDSAGKGDGWAGIVLCLFDALFLVSMLLLPLSWLLDPFRITAGPLRVSVSWGLKPLLAPVILLALRQGINAFLRHLGSSHHGLLGQAVCRKLCLAVFSVYLAIGLPELLLAVVGFHVDLAPVVFSLRDEEGETQEEKGFADPELLWKFQKGEEYHGIVINSLGYRDREVDLVKHPGAMRVICMGDSVTAQGEPGYSGYLHEVLQEAPPTTNAWEAFNMAVYGYSSAQGLRVFQLQTKSLAPDIVTLYFGWNDHWLEMKTDSSRMAVEVNPAYGRFYNAMKEKRIFMLFYKMLGRGKGPAQSRSKAGFRVPPEEYKQVLRQFVSEIHSIGAKPLVITAARRNVTPSKEKHPDIAKEMSYNEVHDRYVEMTREVAHELDVPLLDLHAMLQGAEFDGFFMADGIHFKQKGLRLIAEKLHEKIGEMTANPEA